MQVNEADSTNLRRSSRRHAPNINRQEVLTLGEAARLRANLAPASRSRVSNNDQRLINLYKR